MTTRSAPRWALDYLNTHLDDGDQLLNVALVGRNLVLAHTKLGSVVVRKGLFLGTRHVTLGYPPRLLRPETSATVPAAVASHADVSRDWEKPVHHYASGDSDEEEPEDLEGDEAGEGVGQEDVPSEAAPVANDGAYREGPYTLYSTPTNGKPRYFFSKNLPAAGSPSPLPPGYLVGRNSRTGLPFLQADPDYVPENEPATPRDATKRYGGDVHKVIDIEGIGKQRASELNAVGIHDTDELCRCDPAALATALDLGQDTVELWQAMGELMKVTGIGKQYAEVLAYAGLKGIDDLKARNPNGIARSVNRYVESQKRKPIGTELTGKRVEGWQAAARKMRKSAAQVLHPQKTAPAKPVVALDESPGVRIRGPSAGRTPEVHADLTGLDPTRGDIAVQWDTAPQMVAERSHKAKAAEAPVAISGKGNEIRIDLKVEAKLVHVPSAQPVAATASEAAAIAAVPVTPRAAPSLLAAPEGAEVNLAGRKGTPRAAPAPTGITPSGKPAAPVAPPAPVEEELHAIDGTVVEVVKSKGGRVKEL